jgi:hypothetical protein
MIYLDRETAMQDSNSPEHSDASQTQLPHEQYDITVQSSNAALVSITPTSRILQHGQMQESTSQSSEFVVDVSATTSASLLPSQTRNPTSQSSNIPATAPATAKANRIPHEEPRPIPAKAWTMKLIASWRALSYSVGLKILPIYSVGLKVFGIVTGSKDTYSEQLYNMITLVHKLTLTFSN